MERERLTPDKKRLAIVRLLGKDVSPSIVRDAVSGMDRLQRRFTSPGRYGIRTQEEQRAAERFARALRSVEAALKDPHLDEIAAKTFPVETIGRWRSQYEERGRVKVPKRRRDGEIKRLAVRQSAELLQRLGLPIKKSRRGKFCKLAAVLYGDPDADLFYFCREFKVGGRPRRRTETGSN